MIDNRSGGMTPEQAYTSYGATHYLTMKDGVTPQMYYKWVYTQMNDGSIGSGLCYLSFANIWMGSDRNNNEIPTEGLIETQMNTKKQKDNLINRAFKKLYENNPGEISVSDVQRVYEVHQLSERGITKTDFSRYIDTYVGMGFCQQKFYKPSAWKKAVVILEVACSAGLAQHHNYGHGKGKYDSTLTLDEVKKSIIGD